jgi:hypothetical protein
MPQKSCRARIVVLAATLSLGACARPESALTVAAPATAACATLCGRVIDAQSGQPIRQFSVAIFARDPGGRPRTLFAFPHGFPVPPGELVTQKEFSSSDGEFRLPPVASKTIVIGIQSEGRMLWQSSPIDVPSARPLEVRLERAWRVTGTITDDRGGRISGVRLYSDVPTADRAEVLERIRDPRMSPLAVSDDNGRFALADIRIPNLPVALIAVKSGYLPQRAQTTARAPETSVDFQLHKGVAVAGMLLAPDGRAATSGVIAAEPSEGEKFLAMAGPDGRFRFDALPAERLRFSASRSIVESPAEPRMDLDLASSVDVDVSTTSELRLTLPTAATLRGSMNGLAATSSGYWVDVRCSHASFRRAAGSRGEFRVTVPAEPCEVSGLYDGGGVPLVTDTVRIAPHADQEVTAGLTFVNPTEVKIATNGQPLTEPMTVGPLRVPPDADHVYRFAGLAAGSYDLAILIGLATYHAPIDVGGARRLSFDLAASDVAMAVDPPRATVAVSEAEYRSGGLKPERPPEFYGNGEGKFIASGVPEGDYELSISAPGYVARTVALHMPGGGPAVKLDPIPYPFPHPAAAPPVSDDERAVLNVVVRRWIHEVKTFWRENRETRGRLVLLDQSARPSPLAREQVGRIGSESRDIRAIANSDEVLAQPLARLPLQERAEWPDAQTEIDTIDLEAFYDRYPKAAGLLTMSRAAIADDDAVVVGECALGIGVESRLFHLRRRNGLWRIESSIVLRSTPGC